MLSLLKKALLLLIDIYRFALSSVLPPGCRFTPSCSQYTRDAVELHGPFKGMALGTRRILKCHPFHPGGHDPVKPAQDPNG